MVQPGERAAKSVGPQNRPTTAVSINDMTGGATHKARVGARNFKTAMGCKVGTLFPTLEVVLVSTSAAAIIVVGSSFV
jgi:hypothetical protein